MSLYYSNPCVDLYQADAREIPLPDQSAHCVVTSPPYFGLRRYKAEGKVIGLEQTPEEYLDAMMEVFDEVYRVLRDDGICWVNLGDSYAGSGKGQNADGTYAAKHGEKQATNTGSTLGGLPTRRSTLTGGLPANVNHSQEDSRAWSGEIGQLLNIPHRFALRMQERGWIHRDTIIWHKRSPMPESLGSTRWERCRVKVGNGIVSRMGDPAGSGFRSFTLDHGKMERIGLAQWADCPGCARCAATGGLVLRRGSWRCTDSYEVIFMFVKGMGYFCDGEAVKMLSAGQNGQAANLQRATKDMLKPHQQAVEHRMDREPTHDNGYANRRNIWSDIKPEPFGGQHYATFPPDLPRICIQASTSEAGVCSQCGAQVARVVEKAQVYEGSSRNSDLERYGTSTDTGWKSGKEVAAEAETRTLGWKATCTCNAPTVPALVLDPFCGTGTTCLAAMRLGRRSVGVDLSADYLAMAQKRLEKQTLSLF